MDSKYCPNCHKKLDASIMICPFCDYDLITKEIGKYGSKKIENTRLINKNGLSFECPEYYEIGNFPNSDEIHKNIVALSKKDRTCELYIMEYWNYHFDDNAKRNSFLLKEYLKLQGYENVTENRRLPYCFNANINSELGKLKTTILYNFNFADVIMIVGNTKANSYYDCTNDIKIINESIITEKELEKRDLMSNEDGKKGIDIYGKGLRYAKSGDLIKAGECYREAIELLPSTGYAPSLVWGSWGDLFKTAEMYDNAKQCYRNAITCDNTNDEIYIELIKLLTDIGEFQEAIDYIDKYLIIAPEDDFAWSHKGVLLNILDRPSEARICLRRAEELNPNNPQVLIMKEQGRL